MSPDVTILVERGYPLDGQTPPFEAVRIIDGVVVWAGTAREARQFVGKTTLHSLEGAFLIPGLVDTHLHLGLMGRGEDAIDLRHTRSTEELVSVVASQMNGPWIEGVGWDDSGWTHPLDAQTLHRRLPDIPIILYRRDHHAAWVSHALLQRSDALREGRCPPGGQIERGPDGQPSGMLLDAALTLARDALPPPSPAQRRRWLERALIRCREAGLTGVHEICTPGADLDVLAALATENRLPVRVATFLHAEDPVNEPRLTQGPTRMPFLDIIGAKLFCDGALGSRGAWLSVPYADQPKTSGLKLIHGHALQSRVIRYAQAGFAIAVHGIGDAAVDEITDAFEAARAAGVKSPLRIEHAQIVHPQTIRRLAALDIICAVQPIHALDDAEWYQDRVGPRLGAYAYRLRSFRDGGVHVVLGTDAPISGLDPIASLRAAVTKTRPRGAREALTIESALECHSLAAGYAMGRPPPASLIGRRADFTVLDRDPLSNKDLGTLRAVGTIIDGRWSSQSLEPIPFDL